MGKFNGAVAILIVVNVIFFAITFGVPGMNEPMFEWLALYFPKNEHFGVWQFVTNMFMHGGFSHIIFNMYALWALGQTLEPMLGRLRFGMVYFACLLGGSAGAILLQPNGLHGGASGAVFGLFGLIMVGYLQRGINPLTTSLGGVW